MLVKNYTIKYAQGFRKEKSVSSSDGFDSRSDDFIQERAF